MKAALHGVRVLESASFVAGPHAGMILGDLGAEVIKVEPLSGDSSRKAPPHEQAGATPYFRSANRNKKSLTLDLQHPEGRQVFYDLARVSDVLVAAHRPGVLARLGLGYEELSRINPRIIVVEISGFGQNGPYRDRPGYDFLAQAYSGIAYLVANEGELPRTTRLSVIDVVAGTNAAVAVLAALHQRHDSGRGQFIDIALLDSAVSLLSYHVANYFAFGAEPERPKDSAHPHWAPCQVFQTKDDAIFVAALAQHQFRVLCEELGIPDIADDSRFDSAIHRAANREHLAEIVGARLASRTTTDWLKAFVAKSIPAAPLHDLHEALADEQVSARSMVVSVDDPDIGMSRIVGNPYKMPGAVDHFQAAPRLGEHTHEILEVLLGYPPEKVAELDGSGALRRKASD